MIDTDPPASSSGRGRARGDGEAADPGDEASGSGDEAAGGGVEPRIVPRAEHTISRKKIDENALKVLYRLHRADYRGYLVGGGVRDLLLGRRPKDFDIATDARPGEVKSLFRNSRVIGRRFKIVQVFFRDGTTVEVSTFRCNTGFGNEPSPSGESGDESLLVRRDNTYGTPEEDAFRRDLTINGLFYDIGTFSIIDYVGGLDDLDQGVIRIIGDADIRLQEDPVRIIRAIRHSARTGFAIEPVTQAMIEEHAPKILDCATARILDEFYRDLRGGAAAAALRMFLDMGLLAHTLPDLACFLREGPEEAVAEVWQNLEILDQTVEYGEAPSNPILWALLAGPYLLWTLERAREQALEGEPEGRRGGVDAGKLLQQTFLDLTARLRVGRREAERVKIVLLARQRLEKGIRAGRLPKSLVSRPYYDDVVTYYDLMTRADGGEVPRWVLQGRLEPSKKAHPARKAAPGKRPARGKAAGETTARRAPAPDDEAKAGDGADGDEEGEESAADGRKSKSSRRRRRRGGSRSKARKKAAKADDGERARGEDAAAKVDGKRSTAAAGESTEPAEPGAGRSRSARRRRRRRKAPAGDDGSAPSPDASDAS